jgi:DNA-binding NtrC family response regulator/pSer/pThr/pTyr-binding forkhead associated (FHA) protein
MLARLTITAGEGVPQVCELSPSQTAALGRHRSNTIVLQDKHASRKHAEVFAQEDGWFIRDCETLNGTKVNGERIRETTPLLHGHEIGIGDTRLRFTVDPESRPSSAHKASASNGAAPPPPCTPRTGDEPGSEFKTLLHADELSALCSFMTTSVEETSPRALVARALALVHSQTWATVTGFLSLDPEEPLPKIVLPELASVDIHLSRQLTQRAQREGRLVWLGAERAGGASEDSLQSFTDAVCVPLRAAPSAAEAGDEPRPPAADSAPLGALHVYKSGSFFTERQVRFCQVLAGYLANSLSVLRSRRMLAAENSRLRIHSPVGDDELIGSSPALLKVRMHIARVAPRPCTVLIVGESGVGKELVASALHRLSPRRDGPLVTVNCAAIAASLSDAELFGHREGTFTGAIGDRPGFFQQADEGTLFLDEIGELSLECQAKLLRVIEGKGFRPVGATSDVRVDVRVVAATNRELEAMVRAGGFRQDLYFRLGIPVHVPPLRERAEDVPALATHFLRKLSMEYRRSLRLTEAALARLRECPWPGNVRQLRAVLENAVAMSDADTLDADDLLLPDAEPRGGCGECASADGVPGLPSLNLEQLEIWAIRQALRESGGNARAAAEVLGIHRDTLGLKMKKYEIKRNE